MRTKMQKPNKPPQSAQPLITVGALLRDIKAMKIPPDATIRMANNREFRTAHYASFCRSTNEISMW